MKILFIGGSGNISRACTALAIRNGFEVTHLNRGNRSAEIPPQVTTLHADMNNIKQVEAVLQDKIFDVVANFIAFTPADIDRDFKLFRGKTGQYIFISSASAYQKPLSNPVVSESTPLKNPFWDYSRNKIACEERLNQRYREKDFPITIVRPSLTYDTVIPVAIGSWDDFTIVDRMRKGKDVVVHGDGTSLWTITHSRDFAKGFTGLLGHQQAIGESFHITSDELLNWDQIYQAVAEAAGTTARIVHIGSEFICKVAEKMGQDWMWGNLLGDKSVSTIFDNAKIKRYVPGFQASIPFKTGIRETIRWFEADPSRMKVVDENNRLIDTILQKYKKALEVI
ncbi:MAG: SDR family oxidoreductase [Bacteroidota bacterium]